MPQQTVSGIHTRLYARAYIVADPNNNRCVPLRLSAVMLSIPLQLPEDRLRLGCMPAASALLLSTWTPAWPPRQSRWASWPSSRLANLRHSSTVCMQHPIRLCCNRPFAPCGFAGTRLTLCFMISSTCAYAINCRLPPGLPQASALSRPACLLQIGATASCASECRAADMPAQPKSAHAGCRSGRLVQ